MASPQITDASLVAARQAINEHFLAKNPHDVNAFQTGAISPDHKHTKSGVSDKCSFTRASGVWWKGKQLENNVARIDYKKGILIEEGTTNLLPAGAENFVTGWTNGTGETCTVTDYPIYIPGVGNVIAKRITGNGAGSASLKYYINVTGRANPHTDTRSVYAMKLSGNAEMGSAAGALSNTMQRTVYTITNEAWTSSQLGFYALPYNSILDIVVYAPQIEAKAYATSYTPPGTTRAAESLAIPVGATQKNLLTLNQATGGDTLENTTGFSAVAGATITRDTTEKWNGTGSIKVVTPGSVINEGVKLTYTPTAVDKILTKSIMVKGSGTVLLKTSFTSFGAVGTTSVSLTSAWQRVPLQIVTTGTSLGEIYVYTDSVQAATLYIDGLQLEEGTTASDWTLPAVDYTNALINPTAGTIEFDVLVTNILKNTSSAKYLLEIMDNSGQHAIRLYHETDNNWRVTSYDSGSVSIFYVADTTNIGDKVRFAIRWSSNVIGLFINGTKYNPLAMRTTPITISSTLPIYVMGRNTGANQPGAYISNLRISKIARSDTEMEYTDTLDWDDNTTFLSQFTGEGGTIKHSDLLETGTNTHAQIDTKITAVDTHLSSTNNPHGTTATQVGALAVTDTLQSVSFDTLTTRGVYLTAAAQTNAPNATDSFILEVFKFSVSTGILQRATAWKSAGNVYTRWYNGTTWSAWTQIYPQPYI